jgi:hypothetical protein
MHPETGVVSFSSSFLRATPTNGNCAGYPLPAVGGDWFIRNQPFAVFFLADHCAQKSSCWIRPSRAWTTWRTAKWRCEAPRSFVATLRTCCTRAHSLPSHTVDVIMFHMKVNVSVRLPLAHR